MRNAQGERDRLPERGDIDDREHDREVDCGQPRPSRPDADPETDRGRVQEGSNAEESGPSPAVDR